MNLKKRVLDPRAYDDISEALAYMQTPDGGGTPYRVVPMYMANYYPEGLKARTIGLESRKLVGVTRYYPTMTPRVVVDFEPAPPEPFWESEKRRFFVEQRIVYVPILLEDRMDEAGFQERVDAARKLMVNAHLDIQEDAALGAVMPNAEYWVQDVELVAALDAWCLQQLREKELREQKSFSGVVRGKVLMRIKQEEIEVLRRGLKNGSIVDPVGRYREPATAAQ